MLIKSIMVEWACRLFLFFHYELVFGVERDGWMVGEERSGRVQSTFWRTDCTGGVAWERAGQTAR
jgi:hypothetical protein